MSTLQIDSTLSCHCPERRLRGKADPAWLTSGRDAPKRIANNQATPAIHIQQAIQKRHEQQWMRQSGWHNVAQHRQRTYFVVFRWTNRLFPQATF